MVVVRVDGADELIEFLKEITSEKKADQVIKELAYRTAKRAYELAPEKTGDMENNVHVEKEGDGYSVVCDLHYGFYQEWGTYKLPVGTEENPLNITSTSGKSAYRPWIRPAAYQILDQLDEIINAIFFGSVVSL
jgi:hypothetical protein